MPMEDNLLRRMVWEIVSKAALRSRRIRMEIKPESAAIRRSLVMPFQCYDGDGNQIETVHIDCFEIDGNGVEKQRFSQVFWR